MALINIPTSGIWSSIASALNAMFTDLFGRTGYVTYSDTQYTSASPLVVAQGSKVPLPNNAGSSLSDQLPVGVTSFYNGTNITATDNRAAYIIRISFKVESSSQTGSISVTADISPLKDGSNIILTKTIALARGAGTEQDISYSELYFSRDAFVPNGALIEITSIAGATSVYEVEYVIAQIHKGR